MAKPVSLQLYSVREAAAKDFSAVLGKVARMGYGGVEYAGLHGMPASEVARVVSDHGLVSSSAHVPLPTRETIDQLAEDAETLGYHRIVCGFGSDAMKTEDSVKVCAEKFAAGCELARSVGLSLGMHNHWWEFDREFSGRSQYQIILETVPELYSELDIYWCAHAKVDLIETIKVWKARIPLLHVKDGDLTEPPVHKAVGDGKVPIRAAIEATDEDSLEWLVVELDDCATDMLEAVGKSVRWLIDEGLGTSRG